MQIEQLKLQDLPLHQSLVESIQSIFLPVRDVKAAVLLGSLAANEGDRISDADIILFTANDFHKFTDQCFLEFEADKETIYSLKGFHNPNASFVKYIFGDFISIEVHCIDINEIFQISKPYKVLFDKDNVVSEKLTDDPAPQHENFPVYSNGDDGLIWELFDCIKWSSRGNNKLVREYIKKLAAKL